jgi:hypothetical protein
MNLAVGRHQVELVVEAAQEGERAVFPHHVLLELGVAYAQREVLPETGCE